jgi:hypothetical protein
MNSLTLLRSPVIAHRWRRLYDRAGSAGCRSASILLSEKRRIIQDRRQQLLQTKTRGPTNAWNGDVAFLMKDIVLLAVSNYLLKQDVARILNQEFR